MNGRNVILATNRQEAIIWPATSTTSSPPTPRFTALFHPNTQHLTLHVKTTFLKEAKANNDVNDSRSRNCLGKSSQTIAQGTTIDPRVILRGLSTKVTAFKKFGCNFFELVGNSGSRAYDNCYKDIKIKRYSLGFPDPKHFLRVSENGAAHPVSSHGLSSPEGASPNRQIN